MPRYSFTLENGCRIAPKDATEILADNRAAMDHGSLVAKDLARSLSAKNNFRVVVRNEAGDETLGSFIRSPACGEAAATSLPGTTRTSQHVHSPVAIRVSERSNELDAAPAVPIPVGMFAHAEPVAGHWNSSPACA